MSCPRQLEPQEEVWCRSQPRSPGSGGWGPLSLPASPRRRGTGPRRALLTAGAGAFPAGQLRGAEVCKIATLGTGAGLSQGRNTTRSPERRTEPGASPPEGPSTSHCAKESSLQTAFLRPGRDACGAREEFRRALPFRPDPLFLSDVSFTPGGARRRSTSTAFISGTQEMLNPHLSPAWQRQAGEKGFQQDDKSGAFDAHQSDF